MRRKKALVYFTTFDASLGGSEYLPLECVAALQRTCDVTLALQWPSDVRRAAALYEIPVDFARLRIVALKPKSRLLRRLDAVLPFCTVRALKRLARSHDLCVSCANMIDFGRPAFHFIFFMRHFGDDAFIGKVLGRPPLRGWARVRKAVRKAVGERVLRPLLGVRSPRALLKDRREWFFPNSQYVLSEMRAFYGPFNARVLYPPTAFACGRAAPRRDPLKVVYVGRIKAEKRVEEIVGIVAAARARSGLDFRLEIAGALAEDAYAARIRARARENPWIALVGEVYGERKSLFLTSGTYAVHARRDEEFGIAVAEYLKAGVLPVVPDAGGAPEVVAQKALVYRDDAEAAAILVRLARDAAWREEVARACRARAAAFADAVWRRDFLSLVGWIEARAEAGHGR